MTETKAGVRRYGIVGVTGGLAGCKNGCLSSAGMIEQREGHYVLTSDFDSVVSQLSAALKERDELREALKESHAILSKFGPAAFNILWCAINWNDHNFKEEVLRQKGKRAAELLGFSRQTGVDPVNAFIERFESSMDASEAALTPVKDSL